MSRKYAQEDIFLAKRDSLAQLLVLKVVNIQPTLMKYIIKIVLSAYNNYLLDYV